MEDQNQVPVQTATPIVTPATPIIEAPKINVEEIKAQVIEETREQLTSEATEAAKRAVIESLSGKPETKESDYPWEKENRAPKTWGEIGDAATAKALKTFEENQKQKEEADANAKKAQDDLNTKTREELDNYWNEQLTNMEKEGKLPALPEEVTKKLKEGIALTEDEREDPAIQARGELYGKAKELKDKGFKDFNNLELVWYKMQEDKNRLPEGANAPVLFSNKGITPTSSSDYTYEDIHGAKSASEIVSKAK